MDRDPSYITRSTSPDRGGFVIYEVVDAAGHIVKVGIPHELTVSEWAHPVIQHAVGTRRHAPERRP